MAKRRDVPTRHEVIERVEGNKEDMEKKEVDLDKIASDVETVRHTLENLDLDGTSEGSEEVEQSIESAENVTEQEFDKEDEELEQIQEDNQEFDGELNDRRGSSESDLGKISDASSGIETTETVKELERAKEAALRDIEYLREQIDRARAAREKSDDIQDKLQARVHKSGNRA